MLPKSVRADSPNAGRAHRKPSRLWATFRRKALMYRRSRMAFLVKWPCFWAFLLPSGAPEPGAPPCMRQRFFPCTAGDRHGRPERVLAPHLRLASMGPVFDLPSRSIMIPLIARREDLHRLLLSSCDCQWPTPSPVGRL